MSNMPDSPSAHPVLYVEDEESDALLMRIAFEKAGITTPLFVVSSGRAAMDYLANTFAADDPSSKRVAPCLVLLDLNMPGISGLEVLKWIRSTPHISTLPVLILTSSNQNTDAHRAYLQGANGFLVKPSNIQQMVRIANGIREYWLTLNQFHHPSETDTPSNNRH